MRRVGLFVLLVGKFRHLGSLHGHLLLAAVLDVASHKLAAEPVEEVVDVEKSRCTGHIDLTGLLLTFHLFAFLAAAFSLGYETSAVQLCRCVRLSQLDCLLLLSLTLQEVNLVVGLGSEKDGL